MSYFELGSPPFFSLSDAVGFLAQSEQKHSASIIFSNHAFVTY
jgi:hypothetical protein